MTKVEEENKMLKQVFKDNEYLVQALRSLFFGWDLSDKDKSLIKDTFSSEKLRTVFRQKLFSKWGDQTPIGQIAGIWMNVSEDMIIGASKETRTQIMASRVEIERMLDHAMTLLVDPNGKKPETQYGEAESQLDMLGCRLMARNKYINTIESGIGAIYNFSNAKELTPAEKKELAKQNSSK